MKNTVIVLWSSAASALASQYISAPSGDTSCSKDFYGQSVSTNGEWLSVGAPGDDNECPAGYVHLYTLNEVSGQWEFDETLGSDDGDYFGWSVELTSDQLHIGQTLTTIECDVNIATEATVGSLNIYDRTPTDTWDLAQVLSPSNACQESGSETAFETLGNLMHFGYDVATFDTNMIVGTRMCNADYTNEEYFTIPGYAYLFSNETGEWNETAILTPTQEDGEVNSCFGSSVAISAEWIVVGAPYENPDGKGGIYIFTFSFTEEKWIQYTYIKAPNDCDGQFGTSVDIHDQTITATCEASDRAGYVFLYEYVVNDGDGEWDKIDQLKMPKTSYNPLGPVRYDGDNILVGTMDQAYYYKRKHDDWSEAELVGNNTAIYITGSVDRANGADLYEDILVTGYPMDPLRRVLVTSTSEVYASFNDDDDEGTNVLLILVGVGSAIVLAVGFAVLGYCVWNKPKEGKNKSMLTENLISQQQA